MSGALAAAGPVPPLRLVFGVDMDGCFFHSRALGEFLKAKDSPQAFLPILQANSPFFLFLLNLFKTKNPSHIEFILSSNRQSKALDVSNSTRNNTPSAFITMEWIQAAFEILLEAIKTGQVFTDEASIKGILEANFSSIDSRLRRICGRDDSTTIDSCSLRLNRILTKDVSQGSPHGTEWALGLDSSKEHEEWEGIKDSKGELIYTHVHHLMEMNNIQTEYYFFDDRQDILKSNQFLFTGEVSSSGGSLRRESYLPSNLSLIYCEYSGRGVKNYDPVVGTGPLRLINSRSYMEYSLCHYSSSHGVGPNLSLRTDFDDALFHRDHSMVSPPFTVFFLYPGRNPDPADAGPRLSDQAAKIPFTTEYWKDNRQWLFSQDQKVLGINIDSLTELKLDNIGVISFYLKSGKKFCESLQASTSSDEPLYYEPMLRSIVSVYENCISVLAQFRFKLFEDILIRAEKPSREPENPLTLEAFIAGINSYVLQLQQRFGLLKLFAYQDYIRRFLLPSELKTLNLKSRGDLFREIFAFWLIIEAYEDLFRDLLDFSEYRKGFKEFMDQILTMTDSEVSANPDFIRMLFLKLNLTLDQFRLALESVFREMGVTPEGLPSTAVVDLVVDSPGAAALAPFEERASSLSFSQSLEGIKELLKFICGAAQERLSFYLGSVDLIKKIKELDGSFVSLSDSALMSLVERSVTQAQQGFVTLGEENLKEERRKFFYGLDLAFRLLNLLVSPAPASFAATSSPPPAAPLSLRVASVLGTTMAVAGPEPSFAAAYDRNLKDFVKPLKHACENYLTVVSMAPFWEFHSMSSKVQNLFDEIKAWESDADIPSFREGHSRILRMIDELNLTSVKKSEKRFQIKHPAEAYKRFVEGLPFCLPLTSAAAGGAGGPPV